MWSNGLMTPDLANDERLDPRLRRMLAFVPSQPLRDVVDHEELLAEANTPKAIEAREAFRVFKTSATARRRPLRPACR